VWQLTCHKCEDFLRSDPLWGVTAGSIPETPDETQNREAAEGRTQREQLTNNVDALTRIGDALTMLAHDRSDSSQVIAMLTAVLAQNGVTLPAGAAQAPADTAPATEPRDTAPDAPTDAQVAELADALNTMGDAPASPGNTAPPNLDAMNMNELNAYAKSVGLPGRRSRAEQIAAIRQHWDEDR
jgi:hypothetical protein